jgi:hypothetical protein
VARGRRGPVCAQPRRRFASDLVKLASGPARRVAVIHPNEFADWKAKLADLRDKPFDLILRHVRVKMRRQPRRAVHIGPVTAAVTSSAGIIPTFGDCCRSVWLRKSQFRPGQSFCEGVSNTENPWTVNYRRRL